MKFGSPQARAEEAQARLFRLLRQPEKANGSVAEHLSSVFSTLAASSRDSRGIHAPGNHVSYKDNPNNKLFFSTLTSTVAKLIKANATAEVVFEAVRSSALARGFHMLSADEIDKNFVDIAA